MKYISAMLFASASGAAASVLLLIFCRIFRRLISHRAQYLLWTAVICTFMIPAVGRPGVYRHDMRTFYVSENNTAQTINIPFTAPSDTQKTADNTPVMVPAAHFAIPAAKPVKLSAFSLWLTAAAILFIKKRIAAAVMRRRLARITDAADEYQKSIFAQCCRGQKLRQKVTLLTICADCSPFVTGILRPKIVIPRNIDTASLRTVFMHELTHCKRLDLLCSLICETVCILHWFNPLAWFANSQRHKEMEFSCDEQVASKLDAASRKEYIASILSIMRRSHTFASSACLSESGMNIKKRIDVIMNKKCNSALSGALAAIMLLCSAVSAYAIGSQNTENDSYSRYETVCQPRFEYTQIQKLPDSSVKSEAISASNAVWEASLTNTAIKKSFSAYTEAAECTVRKYSYEKRSEVMIGDNMPDSDTISAEIRIDMTEFMQSYADNTIWKGKFKVVMNDDIIAENATGFLENIPSGNLHKYTLLSISLPEYDRTISLTNINFNVSGTDIIDSEAQDAQKTKALMENDATVMHQFESASGNIFDCTLRSGNSEKIYSDGEVIFNKALGNAVFNYYFEDVDNMIYSNISLVENTVEFLSDSSLRALFSVSKNTLCDYINAVLTVEDGKITLISEDNTVNATFVISDDEVRYYYRKYFTDAGRYENFPTFVQQSVSLDKLPFTMRLTDAGIQIRFDNSSHFRWQQAIATYSHKDNNMFETVDSLSGETIYTFPLINDGRRHYIYTIVTDTEPCARVCSYDVGFSVVNGELFFSTCTESYRENNNLTGSAAEEVVSNYLVYKT